MRNFYNQDKPDEIKVIPDKILEQQNYRYSQQAEKMVKNSTTGAPKKERPTVTKADKKRAEIGKRLLALGAACMVAGGIAYGAITNVIETIHEAVVVNEATYDFQTEVIVPNTHRTADLQNYYYDYDEIVDYIKSPGLNFSTELYKVYSRLGTVQTEKVLQYAGYSSLDSFLSETGYKNIDDWASKERRNIVLQEELNENRSELNLMQEELSVTTIDNNVTNYTGGK